MMPFHTFTRSCMCLALCFSSFSCRRAPGESADTVFFHGRVHTMDSANSVVEAFAVRGGRIVAIGSTQDILSRFETAERVDLHAADVFP
ncbi:MAG: hypothetical protein QHI48_10950, partial [Bacteroidota bacterium]|nr:hypothetical protein [Bacteroidota bacterium]